MTMLEKIIEIAHAAGEIALSADADKNITSKEGRANFVTAYDKRVEDFIAAKLRELLPEADFICEESAHGAPGPDEGCHFVIDPIDGTTNFIRGLKDYAVCIGLKHGGADVIGVVHVPARGVTYFAEAGKGAYKREGNKTEKISVSTKGLDGALLNAGTSPYREDLRNKFAPLTHALLSRAADIRRSGSAAVDICLVAEGVCDLMYECELSPWDHTAAGIILHEAGGVSSNFDGTPLPLRKKASFAAGNKRVHKEFIEFIKTIEL